jgi:hypothetical protein
LADFLSNIPHVANDWPKLENVLGTGAGVCSHIKWKVNTNILNVTEAISDFLSDWCARMGRYDSTVSLLCFGSANSTGTGVTKGLKNIGFDRVVGTEKSRKVVTNRNV